MKITIENTDQIVQLVRGDDDLSAVPGRVWVGQTESGIPVQCIITRIAVHNSERHEEFERELTAQPNPRPATLAFPLRMIL